MALGLVYTPFGRIPGSFPAEVTHSGPDYGRYKQPEDPYYYQRGEAGFYPDTPIGRAPMSGNGIPSGGVHFGKQGLGALPTDHELATQQCYTPVNSAWIRTTSGYMAPPWVPTVGPGPGLGDNGSGQTPIVPVPEGGNVPTPVPIQTEDPEDAHRRRMFILSVISTTAVVAVSLFNIYRSARAIKQGA